MSPPRTGRPRKDEYLTTAEAAAYLTARGLHASSRTVARWCDRGELMCIKPGPKQRDRRILPARLDEFLLRGLTSVRPTK